MRNYYRLKCSLDPIAIENRLSYNPHTIELHLYESDLYEQYKITDAIRYIRSKGVNVVIHHPWEMDGKRIDINREGYGRDLYFLQLGLMSQLADEEGVFVVFHGNFICEDFTVDKCLSDETFRRIENVNNKVSKNILWENAIWSSFSYTNPYIIEDIIKPLNLNLCFDISNAFIDFKGDNTRLLETVKLVDPYVKHYHVVDSLGVENDGLTLGDGNIDFKSLKPYIEKKSYIFEVDLKDYNRCDEMIESAHYFAQL